MSQRISLQSANREFQELLQLSETVAKSKATVLISGEAGCGKKVLAQSIHQQSQRAQKTLQIFNCKEFAKGEQDANFAPALETAKGGTLLIVEIALLNPSLQNKLFQAMQENLDIRFIATTSKSLSLLVKQGEFREDLFYRLNVVSLQVPNLCERMGDVEFLAKVFAKKWADVHGKVAPDFSAEALQLLNGYRWPGNIREIESTIERAVLLSDGVLIRARDLQFQSPQSSQSSSSSSVEPAKATAWKPGRTLDEIERNVILEALKHHDGNRTHTAKALGISIRTLRNKLAEYRVMGINA